MQPVIVFILLYNTLYSITYNGYNKYRINYTHLYKYLHHNYNQYHQYALHL